MGHYDCKQCGQFRCSCPSEEPRLPSKATRRIQAGLNKKLSNFEAAKLKMKQTIKVPEGWKLVPEEADWDMAEADWNVSLSEAHTNGGVSRAAWRAMIAKSPQPPEGWEN